MLVGQVLELVDVLLERGVVDQDVEPAERLHGLRDRGLAEFRIGDVARQQDAAAPFVLDRALGFVGVLVLVEIGDRDVGAFAGEQHRDRAADAGIAAGDERHHVEKLFRALVMRRVVHRLQLEVGFEPGFFRCCAGSGGTGYWRAPACIALGFFLSPAAFLSVCIDPALDGALLACGGFCLDLKLLGEATAAARDHSCAWNFLCVARVSLAPRD